MKRRIVIFSLAALLCVAAVVAWKYRAAIFRNGEVSELYMRYKDTPGVDATFIRGFQVNDTLSVDVTLLQATDSAGWEQLVTDFQVPREFLNIEFDNIISRKGKKGHANQQMDSILENNDQIMIAVRMKTISIFHITDKSQFNQIIRKHLSDLKDK
ncbi:MAG: hypothetical protein IKN29_05360 [Bacteroidales bacterium]|nr:hypothetical protein [Bacteroidales bacterium]MBR6899703.1 hypothetical protein [Bacteroidales bacterium]